MARVVGLGPQQPVFVVPSETHDLGWTFVAKAKNCVDAASRIRAAVDVIAEEYDDVSGPHDVANLLEQIREGWQIPVDVADGYGGHDDQARSYEP